MLDGRHDDGVGRPGAGPVVGQEDPEGGQRHQRAADDSPTAGEAPVALDLHVQPPSYGLRPKRHETT